MRKLNNLATLGLVAGILGNIPKTIVCRILNRKGISKLKCSDLLAGVFLPAKQVNTKEGYVFSIMSDFLIAGLNGISFVYFLNYIGKKHAIFKGCLTGLSIFGFNRGIVVKFGRGKVYPKDITTNLIMALTSSIWGISTAYLTKDFLPNRTITNNASSKINSRKKL